MNMNFEKNKDISFKPKSLFEDIELRERLLKKKKEIVDQYRPKESDFIGAGEAYTAELIQKDLKEIEEIKLSWEGKDEQEKYIDDVSSIYEGVIADQIDANAWFGENCESMHTSEYDDIKNGVDVVTKFNQSDSDKYLGLGVDVTFASNKKILERKLESIKQCIRSKTLPSLKYFQDPDTGERKEMFLPKVIIGSRLSSAENLIQLWGGKDKERNKKLAHHPVASKIIMESLAQLKYFYGYAESLYHHAESENNEKDMEAYKKIAIEYAKMNNVFVDIHKEKKEMIDGHLREISDDIVYQTICEYTGSMS